MAHKIQEFMRGSVIEFQQNNSLKPNYGKWITDIVWGVTTDENERDVLEVGQFGRLGYIDLLDVRGKELTESILIDYGFIFISNGSNISTYYRDDFGYIKLDTYGVEHVYMKGKPIKYLHNFQRIFFDYKGYILYPKISSAPKQEFRSKYVATKQYSADEILSNISSIRHMTDPDKDNKFSDFKIEL